MSKSNKSITVVLLSAFYNVLTHFCILGDIVTTDACEHPLFMLPPRDVIEDIVNELISRYGKEEAKTD